MDRPIDKTIKDVTNDLFNDNVAIGSKEYANVGEVLTNLHTANVKAKEAEIEEERLKLEVEKLELEKERLEIDRELAETEKKKPWIEIGKTALTVVGTAFLTKKIMKFEENGCLTSKSWNWVPKFFR